MYCEYPFWAEFFVHGGEIISQAHAQEGTTLNSYENFQPEKPLRVPAAATSQIPNDRQS
jgi:hypothetical protein